MEKIKQLSKWSCNYILINSWLKLINNKFIHLRNNKNGQNYIVKRVLYKDNKSEWFLNDKSAKLKEVYFIYLFEY